MDTGNLNIIAADREPPSLGFSDIVRVFKARKWQMALVSCLVFVPALLIVLLLPPLYKSSALILVESQQIPEDLVRSTVTGVVDERIHFIRQKVLTRKTILRVVEKFGLYEDIMADRRIDSVVDEFLKNTELKLTSADVGNRQTATIAFELIFFSDSPTVAQSVANELVTLFLNENVRTRSERAAETTEFLREEGEKLKVAIQRLEVGLMEFKQNNRDTMPEVFEVNMARLERTERDYKSIALDIESLKTLSKSLEIQRQQVISRSASQGPSLGELRRSYSDFLVENLPDHPRALKLQRQIRAAEETIAKGLPEVSDSPELLAIQLQLETTNNKLELLEASRTSLSEKLTELESRISESPLVEQQFMDLQRDMDGLTANYDGIRNKELEARIAQNLETERKGERFALLEPPTIPELPSKPNRLLLLGGAIAAALGAAVGLTVVLEMLNEGLYGTHRFTHALGFTPLASIPYVQTTEEVDRANRNQKRFIQLFLILVAFVFAAIHLFVVPLGQLGSELSGRFSSE